MDEIRTRLRNEFGMYSGFEGVELHFNASVYDWFFRMTRVGYASTVLYKSGVKLQWVGDKVRTFKPDSVLTVQVKKNMNYFCCTLLQIHLTQQRGKKVVTVVLYCLSMASMQCIYPVSKYLAQVRLKIFFFFCEKIPDMFSIFC